MFAPTIEKVVQAMAALNEFFDSDAKTSSETVTEALVLLNAFVHSQSSCANAIVDLLNTKDDLSTKNNNMKEFCVKLIGEKLEITKSMVGIKAELKNLNNVNELLLTEHKELRKEKDELKTEVDKLKTEVDELKALNKSLTTGMEKLQQQMEQLLAAAVVNVKIQ